MLSSFILLLATCLGQDAPAAAPPESPRVLTVETLDGQTFEANAIQSLTGESVAFATSDGARTIERQSLATIHWGDGEATGAPRASSEADFEVQLQDDSVLLPTAVTLQQRVARLATPAGDLSFPGTAIRVVRMMPVTESVKNTWTDLVTRDTRNDLLVIRKGEALEFVGGVVGDISEKDVKLLVRNREVAVPRTQVFGVIYVRAQAAPPPAICEVQTLRGDRLHARNLALSEDALTVSLIDEASLTIPVSDLAAIDFTLGRVKALGDVPMDQKQHAASVILTPSVFEIRKNHTSLGQPLRIGDRDYSRGLWFHSGATGTFRLQRQFQKLTATVGLDANSTELSRVAPEVKLTITGDGKPLFEAQVAWNDAPLPLDLDVSGVRDLEIRVDSLQETPGILEHLDLGDARLIR